MAQEQQGQAAAAVTLQPFHLPLLAAEGVEAQGLVVEAAAAEAIQVHHQITVQAHRAKVIEAGVAQMAQHHQAAVVAGQVLLVQMVQIMAMAARVETVLHLA